MSAACSPEPDSWIGVSPSPDSSTPGSASPTRSAVVCSSDAGPESPSTRTCATSPTQRRSLSSREDSPANPSRLSDDAASNPTNVGSGRTSRDSFAIYDPDTCSWKTSQVSLLPEWETFSEGWPRAGMTRSGTAYLLPPSVPRTSATDFSFWPTPVAHDDGKTPEAHLAMKARMPGGERTTITSLTVMVKAIAQEMWPTPTASLAKGPGQGTGRSKQNLRTAVREAFPTPTANRWSGLQSHGRNALLGPLNPTWVEWLMGCPLGWTDCELSETASSLKSRAGSPVALLSVKE
jgi:hypothetical protein